MPGLASPGFVGDGDGNTERFEFVDSSEEGLDFFEDPFVFPWASAQPNDDNFNQDCIT